MNDEAFNLFVDVKKRWKIEDVVAHHGIELKEDGEYMKGFCLLCGDKTKLTVSVPKQLFYCHACHEGGDVITFHAKVKEITQHEAACDLKKLWFIFQENSAQREFKIKESEEELKECINKLLTVLNKK